MHAYVLDFDEIDETQVALVGGKGSHLGELSRIEGIRVPAGFCVTTAAFELIMADAPAIEAWLDALARLQPNDREAIRALSAEIRQTVEALAVPPDVAAAIARSVASLGEQAAYAVRSSATAEDSPTASFAGQQDTYLNVVGTEAILQHVRRCWASLFTERAVTYRLRSGLDHHKTQMGVVVQHMVFAEAAGILFTADPVTGNRKVASVEASFGLGEALVSGLVNPDVYRVRAGETVTRTVATKQRAILPSPAGGTREQPIEPDRQEQSVLTDAQVVRLARLGRRIEAHFGRPQDIEWCLVDEEFFVVQSRPITTLFPIPLQSDAENHVYLSVGHQQMMTDAMKPLGLSFWQMTTPRPMAEAGGRLFVDITQQLASPSTRAGLLELMGKSDPLILDALQTIFDRGDFIPMLPDTGPGGAPPASAPAAMKADPTVVDELIRQTQASIAELKREIRTRSGPALLDFIQADMQELRRILFDRRSYQVFMTAIEATWWLNEHVQTWLGEKNVADVLTQSVPNNVTSEMGLALLDVADAIRPHPEVVAYLESVLDDGFLDRDELSSIPGAPEAREAIRDWLDRYGMRCVGEIDITRPRWSERPSTLLPMLLGNINNFEPGAGKRRFEVGRQEALNKKRELLERLRALPDGEHIAEETEQRIDQVRTFIGYREYPKYGMISRYFVYKRALLEEAERLVQERVLHEKDDIFFLRFQELEEVVRSRHVDAGLVLERQEAFRSYQALTPPRVLTSEGEGLNGSYRRSNVRDGALLGLAVSAGTVEGRARVVLDMAEADLEPGDILVTAYTDPSWTPLFVTIGGLVTEVGGMMTHGAVIAREYGVPAVVGVSHATRLIEDGQRIRVDGTDGYIDILE
jgi:phosphoenolpyruvate synthase/pyruvate phosphate dikinase